MRKINVREKLLHEEGYYSYQYKEIKMSTRFIKTFDVPDSYEEMTLCARLLMRHLFRTCDNENGFIKNDEFRRQKFLSSSNVSYSEIAVKKAYRELVNEKMLIPIKRGLYILNPIYFYKGSQANREKILKKILEFKNGVITFEELIK